MKRFPQELDQLTSDLVALAEKVEETIRDSVRALDERLPELARRVITGDEVIDREEVRIEEECVRILVLSTPVAGDLRRVIAVLKINNDLERIADLAVDIAERAEELAGGPEGPPIPSVLISMEEQAIRMVSDCLNAFVGSDVELARSVLAMDDGVDRLYLLALDECKAMIRTNPDQVDAAFRLASVARYLERMADHATNIAEDVVYLMEGEVIRHQGKGAG